MLHNRTMPLLLARKQVNRGWKCVTKCRSDTETPHSMSPLHTESKPASIGTILFPREAFLNQVHWQYDDATLIFSSDQCPSLEELILEDCEPHLAAVGLFMRANHRSTAI